MKCNTYELIVKKSQLAYACLEILLDYEGNPRDFCILEVNSAFEKETGLKKTDVTGRNGLELFPEMKSDEIDLIRFFGEIALNGGERVIDFFFSPLNRWLEITAFSLQEKKIIVIVKDITSERIMKVHDYNKTFEEIVFQGISDRMLNISNAKIVLLNIFDAYSNQFKVVALSGDKSLIRQIENVTGVNLVGYRWNYCEKNRGEIKQVYSIHHSINDFLEEALEISIDYDLNKAYSIGDMVTLTIFEGQYTVGEFFLILSSGQTFVYNDTIDNYLKQIYVSLAYKSMQDYSRKVELRYKNYIENAPEGIIVINDKQELLEYNNSFCRLLGYSEYELSKLKLFNLVSNKYLDLVSSFFTRLQNRGKSKEVLVLFSKNAEEVLVSVSSVSLSGNHYLCFLRDITLQKKLENVISENSERLKAIVETIPDLICIFNRKGVMLEIFPSQLSSELIEKFHESDNLSGIFDSDFARRILKQFEICADQRRVKVIEYHYEGEFGLMVYEIRISALTDEQFLLMIRDITIIRRSVDLQRLASLTALSASISHEINQPLSGIKVSLQTALLYERRTGKKVDPEFLLEKMVFMQQELKKIEDIVKNLKKITKNTILYNDSSDLSYVVEEVLKTLKSQLLSKNIIVRNDVEKNLPLVRGSFTQVTQIFTNLIDNSIRELSKSNQHDNRVIGLRTEYIPSVEIFEDSYIDCYFSNNGPPVRDKVVKNLFCPFITSYSNDHLGLGLSIIYHIIQSIEGSIEMTGNDRDGVCFKMRFKVFNE